MWRRSAREPVTSSDLSDVAGMVSEHFAAPRNDHSWRISRIPPSTAVWCNSLVRLAGLSAAFRPARIYQSLSRASRGREAALGGMAAGGGIANEVAGQDVLSAGKSFEKR